MLESVIASIVLSSFFATFDAHKQTFIEDQPTYVLTSGLLGGLMALTHAAVSPLFKKSNNGNTALPPEKEWVRSAIALGTVFALEGLISSTRTFTQRTLAILSLSSLRTFLATRDVNEAGWFMVPR